MSDIRISIPMKDVCRNYLFRKSKFYVSLTLVVTNKTLACML